LISAIGQFSLHPRSRINF